jgi:hypothetical protein
MMKTRFTGLLAIAVLGLATPALAETGGKFFDKCQWNTSPPDTSAACVALRDTYRDQISGCMAELRAKAEASGTYTGMNAAHAHRARHAMCMREARTVHIARGN